MLLVKVHFLPFPACSSCRRYFSFPNAIQLASFFLVCDLLSHISFFSNSCRASFLKLLCSGLSIRAFLIPVGSELRTSLEMEQWVFSVFLQKMEGGPWLWFQRRSSLMRLEVNLLKTLFMLVVTIIIIYSFLQYLIYFPEIVLFSSLCF